MKKVLLLLSFLVAFFVSNAQYPVVQFLGRDSALVDSRGGLKARLINYAFTDTTQANTQRISQYPGAFIYTTSGGDKLWLRSSDATLWTRVGTTSGGGNGIASLGTSAYGLIIQNDSTYKVDTILLSTKLWRQKGIDSVQSNVNLKLNITDTANIRARLYAGSNVTITGTYPNLTIASSGSGGGTTGIRFDSSYTPMGGSRGADSFVVKSVRIRKNSITVAPTQVGDSAMYWDISVPEQVNLTAGSNVSITGTYPNLTIASTGGGVSDTSVLLIDTLYNRLATVINTDSMRLKSLRMQVNGSTVTPTETDSTLSYNIIASGGSSDSTWTSINVGRKQAYGLRSSYAWNQNPFTGTDNTPSATVTTDGTTTVISGGANNILNYIMLEDSLGGHNMTVTGKFVAREKSNTSLGFAVAFIPRNIGQNTMYWFHLADTTGYISANMSAAVPTGSDYSSFANYSLVWSAFDTFAFEIKRVGYKSTTILKNLTNGSVTILNIPTLQTGVSDLRIYTRGGEWAFLDSLNVTYQDIAYPEWCLVGNSLAVALTGESEQDRWIHYALDGVKGGVLDMSGPTEQTLDGSYRLADILRLRPEKVIYTHGFNDVIINIDSIRARAARFFDACIAAGIDVTVVGSMPRSDAFVRQINDTMQSLANARSLTWIPVYDVMKTGTDDLNVKYQWIDGFHLNTAGNAVMGKLVRNGLIEAGKLVESSPMAVNGLPIIQKPYYLAAFDATGNFGYQIEGASNGYIRVQADSNTAAVYTRGNAYLYGKFWATQGKFGVNPAGMHAYSEDVVADQIRAISGLKTTYFDLGSGTNRFTVESSGVTINGKPIKFYNSTAFEMNSQPFKITRYIPQNGGKFGIIYENSASGGGIVQAEFKQMAMINDGDTVLQIDRAGGIVADTVHKYSRNFNSWLDAQSLTPKSYVDSMVATVGGAGVDSTTVPLMTFSAGAGFEADTAMITDSTIFGSIFTGQYQYTIKQIQVVIKGNSGDSVVVKLVYNDSFNVDGTKINGAGLNINNRYTGNQFTISTNRTIPVNNWLWVKPEAVITGKKPKYVSITLLGYKTYVAP